MKINKYWLWDLPNKISGTAIVVDTFAAMTNLSIILSKKPKHLIIINSKILKKAKEIYPDGLVVGESLTLSKNTFICSNFPSDVIKGKFKDRTMLYMTSNGTKTIEKVWKGTHKIVGCSFNNMRSVANYIKLKKEKNITVVISGELGDKVLEDKLCADIIVKELKGEEYNWNNIVKQLTKYLYTYYKAMQKDYESLELVLDRNQYNIVPVIEKNNKGFLEIKNAITLD